MSKKLNDRDIVWVSHSRPALLTLEFATAREIAEILWNLKMDEEHQWCYMFHPYDPIMSVRKGNSYSLGFTRNEFKNKDKWTTLLEEEFGERLEALDRDTYVYFGPNLEILNAKTDDKPLSIVQLRTLAEMLGAKLNGAMFTVDQAVGYSLSAFLTNEEVTGRIAIYTPIHEPVQTNRYAIPEIVLPALDTELYDIASVEMEYVEKVFWMALIRKHKEWWDLFGGDFDFKKSSIVGLRETAEELLKGGE